MVKHYAFPAFRTARRQHLRGVTHVRHRHDGAWCDADLLVRHTSGPTEGIMGVEVSPETPVTCFWCLTGRLATAP